MAVTEAEVLEALRAVRDPDLHQDIVTLKFVKDVVISGGEVSFKVELTTPACPVKDELQAEAEAAVAGLPGVEKATAEMTARVREAGPAQDSLPSVKQVIAVASGKGGVGKSTFSVNLAASLAKEGASVGLLDADIYGPSIPLLMGVEKEKPPTVENKIMPITRHGVRMMSLGFLLEPEQAVYWRGPMIHKTLQQLLADVKWGDLDYLIIDLPPGTGDAPMSVAQLLPLAGVVIVSTPHSLAATIAGKAAGLFRKMNAPILGVAENMAEYVCPHCGDRQRLFSGLSGEDLAQRLGIPFLGSVPLDPEISRAGEDGVPSVAGSPDSEQAKAFSHIAGEMVRQASILAEVKQADLGPVA